jgi:hypothetical protein
MAQVLIATYGIFKMPYGAIASGPEIVDIQSTIFIQFPWDQVFLF